MKIHRCIGIAVLALILAACGVTAPAGTTSSAVTVGSIQIDEIWVRPVEVMDMATEPTKAMGDSSAMEMAGPVSAAYMKIKNTGGTADTLLSAAGDVAKSIELHTMADVNGVMQMRPVEGGVPVPANGGVELKPGSFHVMLIGVNKTLKVGDTVNLTLTFAKAGAVQVTATVRQP